MSDSTEKSEKSLCSDCLNWWHRPFGERKTFNHGKEPFSSTSDVESLQEGGSKARYFSRFNATEEGPRSGLTVIEGIVQGGPLPSGISGAEAKKSSAKSVSVEACKIAKAEVPKLVPSPSRTSQKFQHVGCFEAVLAFLAEAGRRCRAKVALQQARMRVRVWFVGERHDLYTQHVAQRKKQVVRAQDQVREATEIQAQIEEKLANGLRDFFLCRELTTMLGAEHSTSGDGVGSQGEHQVESSSGRFSVVARSDQRSQVVLIRREF